jgi:two-component system NarL family response regulator
MQHLADRIQVLVMHDEPLVALGLTTALRQQPDFQVSVHGIDPDPAVTDVVIADYRGGVAWALQARKHAHPLCRVMVITTIDREREVRAALEAGVHGYLLLGCQLHELAEGIRSVARGARALCAAVTHRLADSLIHEALTRRELDVLQLIAEGRGNKAIASGLEIAVGTVKTHVKAILGKLDASSRTEAAAVAARRGLVAIEHATARAVPASMPRMPVRSPLHAMASAQAA